MESFSDSESSEASTTNRRARNREAASRTRRRQALRTANLEARRCALQQTLASLTQRAQILEQEQRQWRVREEEYKRRLDHLEETLARSRSTLLAIYRARFAARRR